MAFYFVRHGQTNWRPEDIPKGPQDLSLNAEGRQQAQRAAIAIQSLAGTFSNAKIVSRTLHRARETAEVIAGITQIPILAYEEGLKERYYGDYRLVADISDIPPDAETTAYFEQRVMKAFLKVQKIYPAQPLIIVAHHRVFEYLSQTLAGHPQTLTQGGICHCTSQHDGTWHLDILSVNKKITKKNTA